MDAKGFEEASSANLSTGPELKAGADGVHNKGVHLIRVPISAAVGEIEGGQVTTVGQARVAKHIGKPRPNDVVVFAGLPWHFVGNKLQPHPKVHKDFPETILELHRAGPHGPERAVWWSEHEFTITTIADEPPDESGAHIHSNVDATPYPFEEKPRTRRENGTDGKPIFVARSTVPVVAGKYKISFMMEGELIDPNMHCF